MLSWIDILAEVVIGIVIGVFIYWLRSTLKQSDGYLKLDLSGEGEPVTLDISKFEKMMTAKRITLDFEIVMPKEEPEKEKKE